jgi:hypothetical protein
MQASIQGYPPVKVGIITGDLGRYVEFNNAMYALLLPVGSNYQNIRGNGFAYNRNLLVREMDPEIEYLWFIDDDHTFDPGIVMNLITRGVDIVQPMCVTRKPPYNPYGYRFADGDYHTIPWAKFPKSGLFEVDAVGTGGMLVHRRVFDAMPDPWFEEGKLGPEHLGEDLWFCKKAKELGFKIYVDCDNPMGHLSTHAVWPMQTPQADWCVGMNFLHGVWAPFATDFGHQGLREVKDGTLQRKCDQPDPVADGR